MLRRWKRPRRVCIIGMGCVTPIGRDADSSCKCDFLFFEKDLLRRSIIQPFARAVV
jgi:hypothetical protein